MQGPKGISGAPANRVDHAAQQAPLDSGGSLRMAGSTLFPMISCLMGLALPGARLYQHRAEGGLF